MYNRGYSVSPFLKVSYASLSDELKAVFIDELLNPNNNYNNGYNTNEFVDTQFARNPENVRLIKHAKDIDIHITTPTTACCPP